MAGGSAFKEEYTSSLADLTFNSKPLINVLTILAEENVGHAKDIVEAIEGHLARVRIEVKLPVLYLIDCIIKNVGGVYTELFCQNIVNTFCSVFEKVDERTRSEMFRLRQTWNEVFAQKKLYALDVQIHHLDPAWPVTAPPPKTSIHFNPKFLKNTPTVTPPLDATTAAGLKPTLPAEKSTGVDPQTYSMQQKIIDKQRELLELQQRKVELELLQTQVKLQEQRKVQPAISAKSSGRGKSNMGNSKNLLLKPEVAKQLNVPVPQGSGIAKAKSSIHVGVLNQKLQTSNTTVTPRIAPVNSALVNARPRDPRLIRLQQRKQQQELNNSLSSSDLFQSKQKSSTPLSVNSDNKIVNSKMSVRSMRVEPRSMNKDNSHSQGKVKVPPRPSAPKQTPKPSNPSRKSTKSRSFKASSQDALDSKNNISSSPSKSNKSDSSSKSRSPSLSPTKIKKKENSLRPDKIKDGGVSSHDKGSESSSPVKDIIVTRFDKKSDKLSKSPIKSDSKVHKSDNITSFKELKGSTKARNYVRRNRNASASPESNHDVDLRLAGPPEKQPRIQGDTIEDKSTPLVQVASSPKNDVDLRQLPAVIGKKRPSTEIADSPSAKKSKAEMFDVLFGSEDTDLRQLPSVLMSPKETERPPTPPPPIISEKPDKPPDKTENKEAVDVDIREPPPKTPNLDLLRAKLANATIKEKLEKATLARVTNTSEKLKLDTDMRNLSSITGMPDIRNKIIISAADEECIKTGNMTKAQEAALMHKIIAQIENQKLKEAQRRESESFGNISLQPISDDELAEDISSDSPSESEENTFKVSTDFGDRDDRLPPHLNPPKFQRVMEQRAPPRPQNWIENRGRVKVWETLVPGGCPIRRPMIRTRFRHNIDPWLRPMPNQGPWRPIGPNFINVPPHEHFPGPTGLENPSEKLNLPHNIMPPHLHEQGSMSPKSYGNNTPPHQQEIPPDLVLDQANRDGSKTITLDGVPRDIRFYDETAIVFLNWDDPREVYFQHGARKAIFDDEIFILSFGEPYKEVTIKGNMHRIRLGGPTREIYIDDKWYEIFFGGMGMGIELDGKITVVRLEGPAPQVKIGTSKRTDLVAGKISLIIDAKSMVPVFLDGKSQKFDINGQIHTLKFVDALRTVLINDVPFKVEFGGLPKPITVHDKKHFIRFSVLPKGIRPGYVHIKDMEGSCLPVSPQNDENSRDSVGMDLETNEPVVPTFTKKKRFQDIGGESPDRNSNSPHHFQNFIHQQNFNNLDVLSSVLTSPMVPATGDGGYQVENVHNFDNQTPNDSNNSTSAPVVSQQANSSAPVLNINDLFQRLVATGIVTTSASKVADMPMVSDTRPLNKYPVSKKYPSPHKYPSPPVSFKPAKPVYFNRPETLKFRQLSLIHSLYLGMQCSSCGMRFPLEQSIYYSQHLDWHFRQNRKGKKNIRKSASRRYYYTLSDWKNYEEIEDIEEREKNYFENQQQQAEGANIETEEDIEIPSVQADPNVQDPFCEVCRDKFEQFYNEEKEEWHLRMAMRVEDKTYHPLCYEDFKASVFESTLEDGKSEINDDENKDQGIPGLEIDVSNTSKDDEKSVIELDDELEIVDDSETPKPDDVEEDKEVEKETPSAQEEEVPDNFKDDEEDDDDVIINEVVPVRIVLDDDDKDDENEGGLIPGVVVKQEPVDDGFMDVENGLVKVKGSGEVKIKPEPVDSEPQEEQRKEITDTTHIDLISSIDGNVELDSNITPSSTVASKIKINISKPIAVVTQKETTEAPIEQSQITSEYIDPSQPLPPGEESIQLNLKPALQGVPLKKLPVVKKGSELSGLCSIM